MLHINDLSFRIEGRPLLENATAGIPTGHKVGLVGRNGSGKTTLLRLVTGELSPDEGSVTTPRNARIGATAQEAPEGEASLLDTVLSADTRRVALLRAAETETDPDRIAEIQLALTDIGSHTATSRAATILAGLGFDDAAQNMPCRAFSGGWRMRVALASVLFTEPDVLLLDEPSNYLDLEGTIWLESYIRSYPHTVIIVSHDRDLLNKAVQSILLLDGGKLTLYSGGYDQFERTRREQQALQLKLKKKQDAQRRHMQAFVDRFRVQANKAKQAQSRIKALARLEPIASVVESRVTPFLIPSPRKTLSPPLLRFEDVSVGYEDDAPILKDISLRLDPDDRIGLLGANGNGKSTFAKLLASRLVPMAGRRVGSKKVRVGYFAQHQLDELNPDRTPYDNVRALMEDATEAQVRARVGSFGFGVDKADTKTDKLSGGEKARLLLSLVGFNGPDLLILDEPTNHLDVDSRQALIQAINDYEGAVVLITHDRHLLETCADRLWLVANGTVLPFEGDMDDYRNLLLDRQSRKPNETPPGSVEKQIASSSSRQEQRRRSAESRARLSPIKREIEAVEKRIASLEQKIVALDERLADPKLYAGDNGAAAELSIERGQLKKQLDDCERDWLELHDRLEEAQKTEAAANTQS